MVEIYIYDIFNYGMFILDKNQQNRKNLQIYTNNTIC